MRPFVSRILPMTVILHGWTEYTSFNKYLFNLAKHQGCGSLSRLLNWWSFLLQTADSYISSTLYSNCIFLLLYKSNILHKTSGIQAWSLLLTTVTCSIPLDRVRVIFPEEQKFISNSSVTSFQPLTVRTETSHELSFMTLICDYVSIIMYILPMCVHVSVCIHVSVPSLSLHGLLSNLYDFRLHLTSTSEKSYLYINCFSPWTTKINCTVMNFEF